MELKDLTGRHVLSAANEGVFKLDGVIYEAVEDPSDGYRSYMSQLVILPSDYRTNDFPPVVVNCDFNGEVLTMTSLINGKEILEVGTINYDDYYPQYRFSFVPENMPVNSTRNSKRITELLEEVAVLTKLDEIDSRLNILYEQKKKLEAEIEELLSERENI